MSWEWRTGALAEFALGALNRRQALIGAPLDG